MLDFVFAVNGFAFASQGNILASSLPSNSPCVEEVQITEMGVVSDLLGEMSSVTLVFEDKGFF
jgi:hypothetical protein